MNTKKRRQLARLLVGVSCGMFAPTQVQSQQPQAEFAGPITPVTFSDDRFSMELVRLAPVRPIFVDQEARDEDRREKNGKDNDQESDDAATKKDKDDESTSNSKPARNPLNTERGPMTLAPLASPNTSVSAIGNGAIPKDVTQGRLPAPRGLPSGLDRDTPFVYQQKLWQPAAICHHPLYFQDTMLERHGHERFPLLQPIASGVRFFGTATIMPYLITLHPVRSNIYNLGHYQPGTAAPCLRERPPYDPRALGVQVAGSGLFAAGWGY